MKTAGLTITNDQFKTLMERVMIEHPDGIVGAAPKKDVSLYVAVIGFGYMEELRKKIFGMKGNP